MTMRKTLYLRMLRHDFQTETSGIVSQAAPLQKVIKRTRQPAQNSGVPEYHITPYIQYGCVRITEQIQGPGLAQASWRVGSGQAKIAGNAGNGCCTGRAEP